MRVTRRQVVPSPVPRTNNGDLRQTEPTRESEDISLYLT